jgi:hypothetical protein
LLLLLLFDAEGWFVSGVNANGFVTAFVVAVVVVVAASFAVAFTFARAYAYQLLK